MASQSVRGPLRSAIWRWWPTANGVVLAAVIGVGLAGALAGWAKLPFASHLKIITLEGMALGLLFAIVGEVLERLKLAPKTRSQTAPTNELELASPLLDPIPIVEAADPEERTENPSEPEGRWPLQTTPSTSPEERLIPPEFVRGAKAIWAMERPPRDKSPEKDGA
jgi:hypothetical protein